MNTLQNDSEYFSNHQDSISNVMIGGHEFQQDVLFSLGAGARCSSVVRAFAHGAMGHRIDPSWGGPIELFLVPASPPRLV